MSDDAHEPITFDQVGCARCGADEHPGMRFEPFTFPVVWNGVEIATHWAPCPTNGEPILLGFVDTPNGKPQPYTKEDYGK